MDYQLLDVQARAKRWLAHVCVTLATANMLKSQNCKQPSILQVRGKPSSLALPTVDGYSGIVKTSIDVSLKGVAPLSGTFRQVYRGNGVSALDAGGIVGELQSQ